MTADTAVQQAIEMLREEVADGQDIARLTKTAAIELLAELDRLAVLEAAPPVAAGRLKVAVDLLRQALPPLESSAAIDYPEDEDGGEMIESLITSITGFLRQYDIVSASAANLAPLPTTPTLKEQT